MTLPMVPLWSYRNYNGTAHAHFCNFITSTATTHCYFATPLQSQRNCNPCHCNFVVITTTLQRNVLHCCIKINGVALRRVVVCCKNNGIAPHRVVALPQVYNVTVTTHTHCSCVVATEKLQHPVFFGCIGIATELHRAFL